MCPDMNLYILYSYLDTIQRILDNHLYMRNYSSIDNLEGILLLLPSQWWERLQEPHQLQWAVRSLLLF